MHNCMDWKSVKFDWNRARAFLVAAEEGSLSAAARALDLTQPTLGRQISALESELGVTLFERVPQGLELTNDGLELIEHVRQMGDAASRLSLKATGQSQSIEGTVCISASEVDAIFRLPDILSRIRSQEPGIEIEVVVSNEVSDLKRREADIAIRSFRPTQPDLIVKKIKDENIWLYGTPGYLAKFNSPNQLKELSSLEVIGFDRTDLLIEALNKHGFQLSQKNIQIVTRSQMLQWELMKRHLGVGLFPEEIGDSESSIVRAFESFGPIIKIPLWLVCHRELHTSLRVRRVFDLLADYL